MKVFAVPSGGFDTICQKQHCRAYISFLYYKQFVSPIHTLYVVIDSPISRLLRWLKIFIKFVDGIKDVLFTPELYVSLFCSIRWKFRNDLSCFSNEHDLELLKALRCFDSGRNVIAAVSSTPWRLIGRWLDLATASINLLADASKMMSSELFVR